MVKVTICGAPVLSRNKDIFTKHNGIKVFFCNTMCKARFEEDAVKFIESKHAVISDEMKKKLLGTAE